MSWSGTLAVVASIAALAGCGHLSGSTKSQLSGTAGPAAVLTAMCEYGKPSHGEATVIGAAMQSSLHARKVDVAQSTDAADRDALCQAYGGAAGLEPGGFEVPAPIAAIVKKTAAASETTSVLVNVAAFEQPCADAYQGCGVRIFGARVREVLFSADAKVLWTKWDFIHESETEAPTMFGAMYAEVPAVGLVTARDVAAPPPAPPAAPPPAAPPPAPTPTTLLAQLGSGTTTDCTTYAKLVCDRDSLDACRDAVTFASAQPSPTRKCKALTKRPRTRKVATR